MIYLSKKNMKKIIFFYFIFQSFFLHSQIRCASDHYMSSLFQINNLYKNSQRNVNKEIGQWTSNNNLKESINIITIPVVVHVIWEDNTDENISDMQILSQIEILNKDFRRTNIDVINTPSVWNSIAADCEIEFCLASVDPYGNATSGINRVKTSVSTFNLIGDKMKSTNEGGTDPWPINDYLNIWVCDLSGGILGYATSPSNFLSSGGGVVVSYKHFGDNGTVEPPYHKGRTTTHEVGHYLGLKHLWGDSNCGDDQINDTPTQQGENNDCPGFPHNQNSCGTQNLNGDMFMNYMDYVNDFCMNMFTQDQKTRMVASINLYRNNFLTQTICNSNTSVINKTNRQNKKLIKIIDILGRKQSYEKKNIINLYIFDDGTVEKKIKIN